MGEFIADNFKREAMKVPLLRELLLTDSVYIASNITFDNLAPLSTYLGKPGDPARAACPSPNISRRQDQHREAEIAALLDTPRFIDRAHELYGYDRFRLRHRRLDLRGGRPRRPRRPGDDDPVAAPAAGLDQGLRGAHAPN